MRQPMKIGFANGCIRPWWRDGVEGSEHAEEWSTEHRRPRNRIDGLGNGVADPGEGTESLLEVSWSLGRTESDA